MKLIVDSGSTKMEWILLDGKQVRMRFFTGGFNPNYSSVLLLENLISQVEAQSIPSQKNEIRTVHYYGTGCGLEQNRELIKAVFENHFPEAEVHVTHDLMAACHAVLGHGKGIACILGTGSNSCVYDGKEIVGKAVSLGYLIGDEGSGMHIGKEVVRACYYGLMPEELRCKFNETYHLELDSFIQKLYHDEQPSRYLASFAEFAGVHQNEPFIHDLVKRCFKAFIEVFILRYEGYSSLKIGFLGSVAFHFQPVLKESLREYGITMAELAVGPSVGLVNYYGE